MGQSGYRNRTFFLFGLKTNLNKIVKYITSSLFCLVPVR
jgi:hypothetical protein